MEEAKTDRQTQSKQQHHNENLYERDKRTSESPLRRVGNGNIEDDDIVNQNSSHDGRSH